MAQFKANLASLGEEDLIFFFIMCSAVFPREDKYEIVKIHWRIVEIFFSRTSEPISTKHGKKASLGEEDLRYSYWRATPFSKERW